MINIGKKMLLLALAPYLLNSTIVLGQGVDDLSRANEYIESIDARPGLREQTYIWYKEDYSSEYYKNLVKEIGWVYPENSRILHKKSYLGGGVAYNVFYNTNKISQRILEHSTVKKEHLIVAGESNVFGLGLEDHQTLPFILSQKYPAYNVYNFGHGGGGPHNTLALLEKIDWYSQIKETDGRMVYLFFPEWMIERVVGTKDYLAWDRGVSPWYELENGKLVFKGTLRDRPLSKILKFITWIDYFKWVGNLPKFTHEHMKLIAKLFEEIKKQYLNKFPKGKFTVVISHYVITDPTLSYELISLLKAAKIDVVLMNKNSRHEKQYHLADMHFSFEGQKMIENELSSVIKF